MYQNAHFFYFRRQALIDALDKIGSLPRAIDAIYITPPADPDNDTDGDSADEDGGGLLDNLGPMMLQAEAEIVDSDGNEVDESDNESEEDVPTRERWKKRDILKDILSVPDPDEEMLSCLSDKSPVEVFQLLWTEDIYQLLQQNSLLYATSKGKVKFILKTEELKIVIGILLLSGYLTPTKRRLFWSSSSDTNNALVTSAMSRNRFEEILKFLPISNHNHQLENDRYAKVSPLVDKLKVNFKKYFIPSDYNLNVDECMIPYFGRHQCKQHIMGKPIRFGFKVWCLNSPIGYLVEFELYQGKTGRAIEIDRKLGKGGNVVLGLLELEDLPLPDVLKEKKIHLYMDNFFSSPLLFETLKRKNVHATGTVRKIRCGDIAVSDLKKSSRGEFDYKSKNGLLFLTYKDNGAVNLLSTADPLNPVKSVDR